MTDDAGPAVDSQGRATPDPTENVLALVDAAVRRLDDLREMERRHAAELREAESKRVDALRDGDQAAIVALASQVAATAEAMRVSAAATASQFTASLSEVQRWQYQSQGGREQVTESQAKSGSIGLWIGLALTALFGLIGAGVGTVGMVIALLVFFTR